jgi:hypothetical protein
MKTLDISDRIFMRPRSRLFAGHARKKVAVHRYLDMVTIKTDEYSRLTTRRYHVATRYDTLLRFANTNEAKPCRT